MFILKVVQYEIYLSYTEPYCYRGHNSVLLLFVQCYMEQGPGRIDWLEDKIWFARRYWHSLTQWPSSQAPLLWWLLLSSILHEILWRNKKLHHYYWNTLLVVLVSCCSPIWSSCRMGENFASAILVSLDWQSRLGPTTRVGRDTDKCYIASPPFTAYFIH